MTNKEPMETACKDYEEDLVLYYYGDCPMDEGERIQGHLKSCAVCSRFFDDLNKLLPLTVKTDEPSPAFWEGYSREVRQKLASAGERRPWWDGLLSFLRPWPVPVFATALVLVLALTLTLTKQTWRARDAVPKEEALLEVLPIAENLDFYKSMDVLDSLDLLEAMGGSGEAGSS